MQSVVSVVVLCNLIDEIYPDDRSPFVQQGRAYDAHLRPVCRRSGAAHGRHGRRQRVQ